MLQLFILTKDRPEELRIALNSALNQDYQDIEVIVSNNSEKDATYSMMCAEFGDVRCISRAVLLSPFGHIKAVIEDANSDFLMLFHDDDILDSNHVSVLMSKIKSFKNLAAVGSNATFIGDVFLKNRRFMNIQNELLIISSFELFQHYLGLHHSGTTAAPLPGFIYRTNILKQVNKTYVNKCGKQGDVQLFAEILNYGDILWLPGATFKYRISSFQESYIEKIYDRIKVLYLMSSSGVDLKSKSVLYYKFMYLTRWWKTSGDRILRYPGRYREKVIAKFILSTFIYLFFSSSVFKKKIFRQIYFIFSRKKISYR